MPLSTFQTGEKTTRALDINGYNATFKAFTDFATQSVEAGNRTAVARDMVAQFLTGRKTATFDTLDAHSKRKAAILMSLLHQGSIACFMTGIGGAFDHEAKVSRLSVGELKDFGGTQHNSFAVTKDKAGNLTIKGMAVTVLQGGRGGGARFAR